MAELEPLAFRPSARLQKFLGRELIADPNVALAEFVKNGYDAGAAVVFVDFELSRANRSEHKIVISDDGTGMNLDAFRRDWMRPGYSGKSVGSAPIPDGARREAADRARRRAQIGEKGLGRLAAARLANQLELFTRLHETAPWLHVSIDWSAFDRMDKFMDEIEIPVDYRIAPVNPRVSVGTVIVLKDLTVNWGAALPGRRASDRSHLRLGRLREDLSIFLLPMPNLSSQFRIHLDNDLPHLSEFNGQIEPNEPRFLDYSFSFQAREAIVNDRKAVKVTRLLRRSTAIAATVGEPEHPGAMTFLYEPTEEQAEENDGLTCGEFDGVFYYSPLTAQTQKGFKLFSGVFLYRDGVRIDPYGLDENDWLGAREWKASRQGHAPIQPRLLTGYVAISKKMNPDLRDQTNRLGLLDNQAYLDFIHVVRGEFRWFGDLIYDEYLRKQWTPPEEYAKQETARIQRFGLLFIRGMAHSIRQSTGGLSLELRRLKRLSGLKDIPTDIAERIDGIADRSAAHVKQIENVVQRFIALDDNRTERLEEFEMLELFSTVENSLRPTARSLGVELRVEKPPSVSVVFDREVLVQVLEEIGQNAVEAAARTKSDKGIVAIWAKRLNGSSWVVHVDDNGPGIDPSLRGNLFVEMRSNKGRPGVGLAICKELITLSGGDVDVQATSDEGTSFQITFPTRKGWRDGGTGLTGGR